MYVNEGHFFQISFIYLGPGAFLQFRKITGDLAPAHFKFLYAVNSL